MTTRELIEKSIIMGVARICLEYGWDMQDAPSSFDKGINYTKERILKGEGLALIKHLSDIAHNYNKIKKDPVLSLEYVHGIQALLDKYIDVYHLTSSSHSHVISWQMEPKKLGNLFKKEPELIRALDRLRRFGKTNINYLYLERYGLKRLNEDLQKAGYINAIIYVNLEEHIPNVLRAEYTVTSKGVTTKICTYAPLMPLLLVSYVQ